jgi:hypothetical protein
VTSPRGAKRILALLAVFSIINFGDKAVLGLAGPSITSDLGLSNTRFGSISSAFYLLFSLCALLVGLFDVAAPGGGRIRLLELGASAGLHQLLAHFHIAGEDWSWGPADSPVQLPAAVQGPAAPVPLEVVSADGCDLDPVDATSAEGRLRLTSFVWPFDLHRHERLAGALRLAAVHQPVVERASAASWLDARLDAGPDDDDALTVVWHSITQLYWPASEIDAVRTALNAYGQQHRLAEVAMEYPPGGGRADQPEVLTTLWSGDGSPPRERRLGTAHDHGIPVRVTGSAGG